MLWRPVDRNVLVLGARTQWLRTRRGVVARSGQAEDVEHLKEVLAPIQGQPLDVIAGPSMIQLSTVPACPGLIVDDDYLAVGVADAAAAGVDVDEYTWRVRVAGSRAPAALLGVRKTLNDSLDAACRQLQIKLVRIGPGQPSAPYATVRQLHAVGDEFSQVVWAIFDGGHVSEAGAFLAAAEGIGAELERVAIGNGVAGESAVIAQLEHAVLSRALVFDFDPKAKDRRVRVAALTLSVLLLAGSAGAYLAANRGIAAQEESRREQVAQAARADALRRLQDLEAEENKNRRKAAQEALSSLEAPWAEILTLLEQHAGPGTRAESLFFDARSGVGEFKLVRKSPSREGINAGSFSVELIHQEWIDELIIETYRIEIDRLAANATRSRRQVEIGSR